MIVNRGGGENVGRWWSKERGAVVMEEGGKGGIEGREGFGDREVGGWW